GGHRGTTSAAGNAEKALDDLQGAVHHGEEALKAVATGAANKVDEARDRLASALEAAKATYAKLEDKDVASAKATDKLVREHPYPSLGVAFGIGLLVGVLINRK
ncbi:MAG: DUF883 domain-containing protein, partial [Verrucomicrobiota bacterium]